MIEIHSLILNDLCAVKTALINVDQGSPKYASDDKTLDSPGNRKSLTYKQIDLQLSFNKYMDINGQKQLLGLHFSESSTQQLLGYVT